MAKKKRNVMSDGQPKRMLRGIERAASLMETAQYDQALELLQTLDRRYPGSDLILGMMLESYYELREPYRYQEICERLVKIDRNDPELFLSLAGAYAINDRPVHAMQTYQNFLNKWPEHKNVKEAAEAVRDLHPLIDRLVKKTGLEGSEGEKLLLSHERMKSLIAVGRFPQAATSARNLIRKYPTYIPVQMDLSNVYWLQGKIDLCIKQLENILKIAPDNVDALADLAKFHDFRGERVKTEKYILELEAFASADLHYKSLIMEILTLRGDPQKVIEEFEKLNIMDYVNVEWEAAYIYHLSAVAYHQSGDHARAMKGWETALEVFPDFSLALMNIEDQNKPLSEQHAPWPFDVSFWISPQHLKEIASLVQTKAHIEDKEVLENALDKYLETKPYILQICKNLLRCGDPQGRTLGMLIGTLCRSRANDTVLMDFALGQDGPDRMRLEAAQTLIQKGVLKPGFVRLWLSGKWMEVLLLEIGLFGDKLHSFPPEVDQLVISGVEAIQEGEAQRAKDLLIKALDSEPGNPMILQNLAGTHQMLGESDEALRIIKEVHSNYPDYLFARTGLAQYYLRQGDTERARELLDPLLTMKTMHFREFDSMCTVWIEIYLVEDNLGAAKSWFGVWESARPGIPQLEDYRDKVDQVGFINKLT